MFFSEDHGHRIDVVNNLNLLWLRSGLIDRTEYEYLQCALVEAVALFSNTSATYQAFYKTYRENTKQEFRLVVPEIIPSIEEHKVYCSDTFELIDKIEDQYELLYLDPPYNWRIYDSNYHLLNLIAGYDRVADSILEFEEGIAGAAGENRNLTRDYTNYNRRETFEDLLFRLILKAKCNYLFGILSPRWRKNTVIPSPLSLLYSTTTARSWRPSAAQSLRHGYSVSTKNTL